MSKNTIKFEFGTDFQLDVLKLTLNDKKGYRALQYYDDTYFELIEHAVIAKSIKSFFKNYKRVPSESLLLEEAKNLLRKKEYHELVTKEDEEEILKMIKRIYKSPLKNGDIVLDKLSKFRCYVELKHVVENVDLIDYSSYDNFANKVKKAITDPLKIEELEGLFLVEGISNRLSDRRLKSPIIPLPINQLNDLTNSGNGYVKGSVIVILDRPKKAKTATLINFAKMLMKRRRKVLYIDIENGADEIAIRLEESMTGRTKKEVLSGQYDKQITQTFRRYKRMGAELIVKEMPSNSTAQDLSSFMDFMYQEHGLQFDDLIIDYLGLMASIKGNNSNDFDRISNAYKEVRVVAKERDINHIYTAHHVKREARKRERTCYWAEDIASCMDIVRHAQLILGLNRTKEEEEAGFQRLEIVEQRDGKARGRAVMQFNQDTQTMKELNQKQLHEYNKIFAHVFEDNSEEAGEEAEKEYKDKTSKGDI